MPLLSEERSRHAQAQEVSRAEKRHRIGHEQPDLRAGVHGAQHPFRTDTMSTEYDDALGNEQAAAEDAETAFEFEQAEIAAEQSL